MVNIIRSGLLIGSLGLLLLPAYAFAHLPSIDPYRYPKPVETQPKCSLDNLGYQGDQEKRRAVYDFCSSFRVALQDAEGAQYAGETVRAKEICDKLSHNLTYDYRLQNETWPFDFPLEGKVDEAIKMCSERINAIASSTGLIQAVKKVDQKLFFVTSVLGLIYLLFALTFKNVRNWKLWTLPIIFQIVISVVVVFLGAISQMSLVGPPIPALHNFLVFQSIYFPRIIFTGFITSLATLVIISLLLLGFRQELSTQDRRKIALFYTLVFNPFFFPVGMIFGLMNLIFLKRTGFPTQTTDGAPLTQK